MGVTTKDETGGFATSPSAVRSHGRESLPAFIIIPGSKIPDIESNKEEREECLLT